MNLRENKFPCKFLQKHSALGLAYAPGRILMTPNHPKVQGDTIQDVYKELQNRINFRTSERSI